MFTQIRHGFCLNVYLVSLSLSAFKLELTNNHTNGQFIQPKAITQKLQQHKSQTKNNSSEKINNRIKNIAFFLLINMAAFVE